MSQATPMDEKSIIALLITSIAGLVTAVVYLYKRSEKREKEMQQLVKEVLNTIHKNETVVKGADEILSRVEKLLSNWRGH